MLIPMGFLAASGAGGAGAYELISTAYGDGSNNVITFSSIPNTYKHLQIRYSVKMVTDDGIVDSNLRFNNDSATSYYNHYIWGYSGSVASYDYGGAKTSLYGGKIPLLTPTTGSYGYGIIDILDYTNTSKSKTIKNLWGLNNSNTSSSQYVGLSSGVWNNTSAINSISFFNIFYGWTTATRVSLYGIKG